MSIRFLVTSLLAGTFVIALGGLYFTAHVLETHILGVLPPSVEFATFESIHLLILEQLALMAVLGLILMGILFLIFGSLVADPLHIIMKAMKAFAADGTLLPVPEGRGTVEIRSLSETFLTLAHKVDAAHKKDEDISRVKSDFISTAAHQLRTPLTGIRWALEALENEPLTEDQKALVKNAADKSHDLVAIVGTLLDISSIESGKYKYTFEKYDVTKIVSEVTADMSHVAQERNVALYYAKDSEIPEVRIDKVRIKWILNNLIENAIRYTPAEGTVKITADVNAGRVYVRVKDTGIGIQAKDRANIFERFYRAGNAIAKENQGNGLGLYIARTIATDHGGDLNFVANTEGPGTTFVLSLPVAV